MRRLFANPVRAELRIVLRMTCVSLLAYILSFQRVKTSGLAWWQAETNSEGSYIPYIVA